MALASVKESVAYEGLLLVVENQILPGNDIISSSIPCMVTHIRYTVQIFNSCISRPGVCQCRVVQTPIANMSKNKPSTSMTHVACESKLRPVARSSVQPCLGNWVAIRCAVLYYARSAHAYSAGIKCRHCIISYNEDVRERCTANEPYYYAYV